jgi:xanthine/CO dehydrogenase XdhC/CoxF family maturation factor
MSSDEHPAVQDEEPEVALLVVGAGEVAEALSGFAATLRWRAHVVDSLDAAVSALPDAEAVVVLSHHDGVDAPAIKHALAAGTPYLGAMGSRRTQERRRDWLLDHGVTEAQLDPLHAPIGLDIGANTPAEIALAIVAEIVAVRRGVSGGSLTGREGPIHPDLAPGTAECPAAPATSSDRAR